MEGMKNEVWDELDPGVKECYEQWVRNPTQPVRVGPVVIGAIYEVNGEGAVQHTTQVTTFEIESLCKYWAGRLFNIQYMWEVFGQTGSSEIRERSYANARLNHFLRILGEEKVEAIVAEVYKDYDPEKAREEYEAWCLEQQEASLRDGPSPEESGEDLAIPPNDERA